MTPEELQAFIQQILPNILQQPRSRADLETEAGNLYNPYYDEQLGDFTGDVGTNRSRLLEDVGLSRDDISRRETRGLSDYGTQESRLNRNLGQLRSDQAYDRGAHTERLAVMGLNKSPLGDVKRRRLAGQQARAQQGFTDSLADLTTTRSRFNEDTGFSRSGLDTFETRGLFDLDKQLKRGKRSINRSRSADIAGHVNDPLYQLDRFDF